ncbi:hypothetical protein LWI29_013519 [Acer saccharum]|uniref:Ubiquitin thioesterase OTU n=1 Tax=Acer saccharum TaxID=4024 RepID=A0AA39W133_ACESA|nr:hypothetical protein LWI29_013519 [Acer saccharum]
MEGIVTRRVIPLDNSCLFNAVRYVMDHDKNKAPELRQLLTFNILYSQLPNMLSLLVSVHMGVIGILDLEIHFCTIELSILADYYGHEIAAYDIQTTRCDLYGQEKKYSERVMLIYDGLHYDALAMSPFDEAPEEFDQTIFPVRSNRTIGLVEGPALNLVKEQHRRLWSMLKRLTMLIFRSIDDRNPDQKEDTFYISEKLFGSEFIDLLKN